MSVGTIYKILKQEKLIKKVTRKHQRKKNLRKEKEKLNPFELIQMDIKYLDDIPHFFPFYKKFKLLRYQITARDVKTGLLFFFFSHEKSVTATIGAATLLLSHLKDHNIDLKNVTIQVDNGSEFSGIKIHHKNGFKKFIEQNFGAKVTYIPPHSPNFNADVESSHRLIEDEFYSKESFSSKEDFLKKALIYHVFFNFIRKNSYRNFKTPFDILSLYNLPPSLAFIPPSIIHLSNNPSSLLDYKSLYLYDFSYFLFHHVHELSHHLL